MHALRRAHAGRRMCVLQARRPVRGGRTRHVPRQAMTFSAGDKVLLIDAKDRRYMITLTDGGEFHSHTGVISHSVIIGAPEGSTFRSSRGSGFTAFRPTL